ncbi:transcription factor E4F1-like [Haliotis rufescens]|uniref:transcription factor E4F1-like n=1 Tax=Haliotis rufescens TaxID=6454 RepID=UPI00201EB40F|nr:transcription factor E4F1-like [Haliotis rufescens]
MNESDKPTNDSLAASLIEGAETDNDSDEDIHYCKKCKKVFTNIQAYLEHKIRHDNFKMTYARSHKDRRMVLPKLVQKPNNPPQQDGTSQTPMENGQEGDNTEGNEGKENQTRKRKRKKRQSEVDVQLIAERSTYICTSCDKKFHREATLRWHIQYEHTNDDGDDEDGEDVDSHDEDETYTVKNDPEFKKVKATEEDTANRPYSCEHCGNRFKDVNVMKTHMLTHSNKRHFPCSIQGCPYAFKTKGSLTRHMRRHTGERPYSCEMCGRSFTESGALTRHMKSRTPCTAKSDADLPRYRKKWDFVPNIPAVINMPTDGDGGVQLLESVDASKGFVYTEVASIIQSVVADVVAGEEGEGAIHQDTDPIEQVITEVASSQETTVDLASVTAEEEAIKLENLLPTQCRVCREDFLTIEVLRHHLRSHLADTPFRCGLCHFVTEKREELQGHMMSQHQTQLKGFENGTVVAEIKEKSYSSNDHRNAQIALRQLLELPTPCTAVPEGDSHAMGYAKSLHKCPACSRTFRGSSYLKQHMKSHTGDRPYKCPVCLKTFISKDTLNKHMSAHSEERHYKCGECGKLFKRISHVREHLKIHSSDRPFACRMCEKAFKTSNALKVHMRTHSNVMPYECRYCHRHFREKGSLARHLRSHTGEKPFKCQYCNRSFSEHGTLNRHLKAKVPCTRQTGRESLEEEEYPTVLAEFSSVVADTQHYLIPEEGEMQDDTLSQHTTEYVVVHTDLAETVQNVEIITEGEVDPAILDQVSADDGTSYIVVSDGGDNIRVLDPHTGQTVAVMPTESDDGQTLTVLPSENEIEAVAMAPLAEDSDAIQQAMMVANVVEEEVGRDTVIIEEEVK